MLIIADSSDVLLVSGSGDVVEPDDGIIGLGSGGNYAVAAARALMKNTKLSAAEIVKQAMEIAADICIYTNNEIYVEEVP